MKRFYAYEEIPVPLQEYILTVANEKSIVNIPLEDINSFFVGLDEFYQSISQMEIYL